MLPFIHIFGLAIPSYGLCILLGFGLSGFFAFREFKRRGLDLNDAVLFVTYTAALGFLGAKLLYVLTILPLAENFTWEVLDGALRSGGLVFYGGLIGGFAGAYLCKVIHTLRISDYLRIIVYFPLAHAIGRIGCFLAGCCYGRVSAGCGIAFSHSPVAPNGVPFFPVQLLEAALNLCIFALLYTLQKKKVTLFHITAVYVYLYAVCRFFLEFLRYDAVRGVFFGLSTSQWISILLIASMGGAQFIYYRRKKAL